MPLDEALALLRDQARPLLRTESVHLLQADGRVLAEDIVAPLPVPPHDNALRDGYAVRVADVAMPNWLMPVSQRIAAGRAAQPLAAGSAARVFTGAPVPRGADAVVAQEDAQSMDDATAPQVRILKCPQPGQGLRRAGEDVALGARALARGSRLTPAGVGLAASMGLEHLKVAARPRVALFSTGDELVMPGRMPPESLPPGAIFNSNHFFLHLLLGRMGCQVTDFGTVPDRRNATLLALKSAAREHDLVLTSGGVSVGDEDHIRACVQQLGQLNLWQIAIKPGKPFAFGQIRRTATESAHFIGLPGNPVSSFTAFLILVRPFLLGMQGAAQTAAPAVSLRADFSWEQPEERREFLRARRNASGGVDLFENQGAGVLSSMQWADGLVDNPAGKAIARGDAVRFIALADLLA
jgi:molybdopterin molybdotransferase